MAVFIDTAALLALANERDDLHSAAIQVQSELAAEHERLVTTDWVLGEFLNVGSRQPLRSATVRMVTRLRQSQACEVLPASRNDWIEAFELFSRRSDKQWSFVDCSSILVCQERGIERVFSSDHHFVQAGLLILLH